MALILRLINLILTSLIIVFSPCQYVPKYSIPIHRAFLELIPISSKHFQNFSMTRAVRKIDYHGLSNVFSSPFILPECAKLIIPIHWEFSQVSYTIRATAISSKHSEN